MAGLAKSKNPFYAPLLVAGVLFVITACAYAVTTVQQRQPAAASDVATGEHPLTVLLDRHGTTLLLAELAVLGVATVAAIGTDGYWSRRCGVDSPADGGSPKDNTT